MYTDAGDTRTYRQTADQGICARALYDYQAGQFFSCLIYFVSSTYSYFVFSALTPLVERQEEHPACKIYEW